MPTAVLSGDVVVVYTVISSNNNFTQMLTSAVKQLTTVTKTVQIPLGRTRVVVLQAISFITTNVLALVCSCNGIYDKLITDSVFTLIRRR